MNLTKVLISFVISFLMCCSAFAERSLSSEEVAELLRDLTSNPKATWMPSGTVEATKEEYRAPRITDEQEILDTISESIEEYQNNDEKPERSEQLQKTTLDAIPFNVRYKLSNEHRMKTHMLVRYDGERFYCDTTVDSRQDSVHVPDELKNNYSTEEFNLDWNGRRIFCYDGEKTTSYTPTISHALIDAVNILPHVEIEPLSSGIIPWGYNFFTYEKLSQINSSAIEKSVDGHLVTELTLINPNGTQLVFVLDPEKVYAPLSWVIYQANVTTVHQYSDYKLVSGSWIPTSIVTERLDTANGKLLSGDYITITSISPEMPTSTDFNIELKPNTLVEYTYDISKPQLLYYYSNTANTELLVAERMAYLASEGKNVQNCATSALQYAALKLGRDILNDQLSQIVSPVDNTSNMHDLKKYAESIGFYCKAVTTDIQTLSNLPDCQAILHIPGKKHFVLLDHIDDKYVWITDLSRDKLFYRTDKSFFGMDWPQGKALLISNQPIALPTEETTEIPDAELENYAGGSGYTCTYTIQNFNIIYCAYDGMNCWGPYEMIPKRYGCEAAESGSCTEQILLKKVTWPCIDDPYRIATCDVLDSQRKYYYMWACQ